MSAAARLLDRGLGPRTPLRALSASGQLGYGVPEAALRAGIARDPHFIGCDMGSIDPGPYYLGSGRMATAETITRRDLRLVLRAALDAKIPLLIGTAGTAGAAPHLAATRALIEDIARTDGLRFRMAVIHADMPRDALKAMAAAGRTRPLGRIPALDDATIDGAAHIVGQMGTEPFIRALAEGPDVILAGRACDTAIFAAIPQMLGYDPGLFTHMAKIIECTSLCCVPGGRDAMLGTLDGDGFVLESMNPERAATPLSVAAHSLYEQADPILVHEPDGILDVSAARFEAVDARRTRVRGGIWREAAQITIKVEGATWVGERAVLIAGSCDPRVIENSDAIVSGVRANVASIIPPEGDTAYDLHFKVYGKGGTSLFPIAAGTAPPEICFLAEAVAPTMDLAHSVIVVAKQFLLHHGFAGRLSTAGNVAFPFTPPEMSLGSAYRFSIYHVADCDDLKGTFPVEIVNL